MVQNTMTKTGAPKTGTQTNYKTVECTSPVEFFAAKISYELSPMALKGMMDYNALKDVCLLDVRPYEQYKQCHISMATSVPAVELSGKTASFSKDKTYVAYCGDAYCDDATKACLELALKGFKVMRLVGGLKAWKELNLPFDKKS